MKRGQNLTSSSAKDFMSKRRKISYDTFRNLQRNPDKDCQTVTWLDCDSSTERGKKVVDRLKCKACVKFRARLVSNKYFSVKWIVGAESPNSSFEIISTSLKILEMHCDITPYTS